MLPIADTLGESYDPAWATIQPKRALRVVTESGASDTSNGDRLRKAMEDLEPGDQLEISTGTYSVDRLWDLTVSGTAESPIWIVVASDAKVLITRPDARQNILNVGLSKPLRFLCLRGLEFTGGSHGIRLGKCSEIWIDQCHIHHTQDVCLSANSADTHHLHLTRNTIHDGSGTAEGMYLGGTHAFRGGSWNARSNMVLANNVIYSNKQNALHFANGSEGVTNLGNVVLGDGPKHGCSLGRGIQDFKNLTWDARERDATPVVNATFGHGVAEYHLPNDLMDNPRNEGLIISGALIR